MDLGRFVRAVARIAFSLLCASIFYLAWMAAFLLLTRADSQVVETILWLLAPVITAAGFATGAAIMERRVRRTRVPFLRIYIWPLLGCAAGAGAVYWFGPMLIVFAMLVAGTASIALREAIGFLRGGRS